MDSREKMMSILLEQYYKDWKLKTGNEIVSFCFICIIILMRKVEFVLFFHECQKFSIECTKFYKNENKRYLDQFFLHRIENIYIPNSVKC